MNASRYEKLVSNQVQLPSGDSALKRSQGVKCLPPDPYPSASRITPPLVHIDMGICTKWLSRTKLFD